MAQFEDYRLDDPDALRRADPALRHLAQAGARIRIEHAGAEEPLAGLSDRSRPRAVLAIGPEARLLRAMLEPTCPAPFVAWPASSLPGWVGPLDLVVVLDGPDHSALPLVGEAARRGAQLIVCSPPDSPLARGADSRATTILPTRTGDRLAAAVVMLIALHRLELGPYVCAEAVADAMDAVAQECSVHADASVNPAKLLALEVADGYPLVWGGSVLAARASRRVAEALRQASGRVALAADAGELLPLLTSALARDPFADPFDEDSSAIDPRPALVVLDDGLEDDRLRAAQADLIAAAEAKDLRVARVSHLADSAMERYATLLQRGRFGAAYLRIGLDRL